MTARGRAIGTIGLHCQLACIWEATARKPGNVHRFQDFDDVSFVDFLASAAAIEGIFTASDRSQLGHLVLNAVLRTRDVSPNNTNLGIVLLLAPLAKAAAQGHLRSDLPDVLAAADATDADIIYHAIRLARPGSLGTVPDQDIRQTPTKSLREVMALAAERDLIARQYANGFQEVLQDGVPALQHGLAEIGTLEGAIIACHLHLLELYPDSLIARKCGNDLAEEASRRAGQVLAAGWPNTAAGLERHRRLRRLATRRRPPPQPWHHGRFGGSFLVRGAARGYHKLAGSGALVGATK